MDLSRICLAIVEEFKISHPNAVIEFYGEENCFGDWDERRIGQILANLISNALSYGKSNAPVKVRLTEDVNRVTIKVNNRGEPISDEARQHLFTAFWRGSQKNGINSGGVGLGLYIVKQIVEAHRGDISVDSNDEDGTTFTVIFYKMQ
jgi:signal transduction histidine kinase